MALTVGTWNVNGIRAREAQVREWLELSRPEIFCLQEIKAKPEQIPEALGALADYWVAWHGAGGYSGVALACAATCSRPPEFLHPAFDFETRAVAVRVSGIEVSSIYVPNGGKDFDAKMRFLARCATPSRPIAKATGGASCAAISTSPSRTATSTSRRGSPDRSAPGPRSGRCSPSSSAPA
jgi:exodeoxyribonuclease III